MKLRLLPKLFLILLTTSAAVVLVMLLLMRWSFQYGFVSYLNSVQEAQLGEVAERLEAFYAERGSWQAFAEQPRLWREITRSLPVPPRDTERGPMPRMQSKFAARQLTLFDRDGRPLVGRARSQGHLVLRDLTHEGEVVGRLGAPPLRRPAEALDVHFLQRQSSTFYGIALVMVAIVGLASLLLARRLLTPVGALASGARSLASGRYETRVPVRGHDELARLSSDFNRLAETLEANETARRRWVADISHELRTPVAVLHGEIEALQDGIRAPDAAALGSLHAEVARLGKLVDDLYQLALSDLGALNYQKRLVDPVGLLQRSIAAFELRYREAGVALVAPIAKPDAVRLFADAERLTQLFHNLLENSLRYTDRGGRAEITWAVRDGAFAVEFQDTAPGVPAQSLPQLFERLYRVESSRNRARGGAGLGLAISRNIVEAHGGRIEARPSPLGGLWVHVELPLTEQQDGREK